MNKFEKGVSYLGLTASGVISIWLVKEIGIPLLKNAVDQLRYEYQVKKIVRITRELGDADSVKKFTDAYKRFIQEVKEQA